MFKPRSPSRGNNGPSHPADIKSPLAALPLPNGSVLLPGSNLAVQLLRQDSINMLEAVLDEADRVGKSDAAILAAVPFTVPSSTSKALVRRVNGNASGNPRQQHSPPPLPKLLDTGKSGDGVKPSVNQLNEFACAARIVRVEKVEIQTNGKSESGYLVFLEGLSTRLRIERFTMTGTPYFEAQVTPFPRQSASEDPVDPDLVEQLRIVAQQILETLESVLSQSSRGLLGSKNKRTPLPNVAPKLSEFALKSLRASINRISESNADELSDFLMSSLLPASKSETFPIKLHHLSLLDAPSRVKNAITQLELLNAGLQAREGVDQRFNRAEQRRARENVLKGLLDSILQELRALKQEEADDLGVPRTPAKSSIRPNAPSSDEDADEDEDDVDDMDDLHKYKQYIKQSSMPEEIRKTCLKELKRLKQTSPMSPEYNKNRDYLDWMLKLPWSKSTYDSPDAKKIDHEFLERARKQLELDHFGIENVKDRLLQYLAVLKLKREQFEEEQERLRLKEEEEKKSIEQKGQQQQQQEAGEDEEATGKEVAMKDSKPSNKAKKATPTPKPNQFRDKGPIICLVGPPGVGKTSIARSLATAMGRPFCRAALGGVSDETDIRGFRRTYVGSMPGLFIHKMSEAGVNNPVILLDEIDKVASGKAHRGDPSAALLEVLDPEQNHAFTDNYINAPVDLSQVTFIATANTTYTIPEPLLDRMELIYLSGYVDVEKLQIARKYLIPKQLRANALTPDQLDIDDKTIIDIISKYSHESGVRTLERRIGAVCRWKAVEVSKYRDRLAQAKAENRGDVEPYNPVVRQEDLEEILGNDHRIPREIEDDDSVQPGHAVGLAYTGDGTGCILHIETASMPGHGHLRLTGLLGEVIQESANIALTWIKANAYRLGLVEKGQNIMDGIDVHIHLPDGSTRVEGPSAGVALTMALLSLFSGQTIDPRLAMTGEITLRGKVTAVGGIKEKCLSGVRAGVKRFILPEECRSKALSDLPQQIRDEAEINFVSNIWQAIEIAFPNRSWNLAGPRYEDKPAGNAPLLSKL